MRRPRAALCLSESCNLRHLVSRIAYGLPIGGAIKYIDQQT
ncbi:MAG: hypothetical protein QME75_02625 [Deltaproteobacteria bacterium]|nr:hypothetical protein [Deltaproteobacteria bacterium]